MAEIDPAFLARQLERLMHDVGGLKDDMTVVMARLDRIDATTHSLVTEVRATHSRHDRVTKRVERLEVREPRGAVLTARRIWRHAHSARQRPPREGEPQARAAAAIAVPVFGYKNHLGIDRRHGFIRSFAVTDAAAPDGRQLGRLLDPRNTASAVWADSAYRSAANAALLERRGLGRPTSGGSRSRLGTIGIAEPF